MKKRMLVLIEDGSFTYDNRVKHETQALAAAGWEITVVCPRFKGDPFHRKVSETLRVYFYPKPEANSLLGHVCEHIISLLLGGILSLWVFLRHGFEVIHACNPMDILWLIAVPYKLLGKRFVYDQHDLCPELFLSRDGPSRAAGSLLWKALLALERRSYRTADVIIATNESYKEIAVTRGRLQPGRVFVVRNGPDFDRFPDGVGERAGPSNGEVVVGYLGNMNRQDGVDYLLKAAQAIVREHRRSDVKFILVGGGSQQPHMVRLAAEMGLQGNVTFTGRISDDQMVKILDGCDICVQPDPHNALNDLSTMNKAMEYMAMAKPVVAFDLRETRVSCEDAALYAIPNNPQDLARKILDLANDPGLRARLGQRGRQRVQTQLAWPFSVPALLSAYEYVMAGEGATRTRRPFSRRTSPESLHPSRTQPTARLPRADTIARRQPMHRVPAADPSRRRGAAAQRSDPETFSEAHHAPEGRSDVSR